MRVPDREPVETLGDPDFTGVDAALRRAGRRARRQAALAGEPVAVYENGEIVLEHPSASGVGGRVSARASAGQARAAGLRGMIRGAPASRWSGDRRRIGMGVVNADVTVGNPGDRSKSWRGSFMVDTGATDSLVPGRRLKAIGIEPESRRVYVLANGDKVEIDVAVARIELMGEMVGGNGSFRRRRRGAASRRDGAGIPWNRGRSSQPPTSETAGRAARRVPTRVVRGL